MVVAGVESLGLGLAWIQKQEAAVSSSTTQLLASLQARGKLHDMVGTGTGGKAVRHLHACRDMSPMRSQCERIKWSKSCLVVPVKVWDLRSAYPCQNVEIPLTQDATKAGANIPL